MIGHLVFAFSRLFFVLMAVCALLIGCGFIALVVVDRPDLSLRFFNRCHDTWWIAVTAGLVHATSAEVSHLEIALMSKHTDGPCIPGLLNPIVHPIPPAPEPPKPSPKKATGRLSMADRLARFFRAHPNEWVDGQRLGEIAGGYAWRTRVSNLRKAPYHMTIENRQRTTALLGRAGAHPFDAVKVSEYRFVPDVNQRDEHPHHDEQQEVTHG